MGMLLHRHLEGAIKSPSAKVENKLEKEFEISKKDKANDNRRKDSNNKNIGK